MSPSDVAETLKSLEAFDKECAGTHKIYRNAIQCIVSLQRQLDESRAKITEFEDAEYERDQDAMDKDLRL